MLIEMNILGPEKITLDFEHNLAKFPYCHGLETGLRVTAKENSIIN